MNESSDIPPPSSGEIPRDAAAANSPAPQAPRSIGVELSENYDVVCEDLRLANELTANLEQQLAGKSKELLHLKFLFEQTKAHMGHLQDGIAAMRKERHKLANDSMRAMGLEIMVKRLTAERDRYKTELESLLENLAAEKSRQALSFDKRDHQIAELTFELIHARQELEDLRRMNPRPAPPPPPAAPRACPLKTSAVDDSWSEPESEGVEIIATERVPGGRRA